jgi:hypothetical protein
MVRRHDDRAQLILVAAIVVSVAILGATVLLNTVHSTPDVSARTDAQSLTDTDRSVQQLRYDLRKLFLTLNESEAGVSVPGADNGALERSTEAYSKAFTSLASTNSSAITNVSYVGGSDGIVAHSNESEDVFFNETVDSFADGVEGLVVREAKDIPRLRLEIGAVTPSQSLTVAVNDSATPGSEFEFTIDDTGVAGDLECTDAKPPVRIDLVYGAGEVVSDDAFCAVSLDRATWESLGSINVTFAGDFGDIDGSYAVSAEDPVKECAEPCLNGIVVNPRFEITYLDPNAVYTSTVTLYERGGK